MTRPGSRPARAAHTAAIRHGSRIAATPPGIGSGAQLADALEAGEVGDQHLAAPHRAVGPVAETVEGDAEHGLGAAVLDHARGDVRVVVLHRDRQGDRGRARTSSTGTRDGGRARRPQAARRTAPADDRPPGGTTGRSRGARGRRCDGSATTDGPFVTAIVLLSSAPTREDRSRRARTAAPAVPVRSRASGGGPAIVPRATRATESSQRMWIGRSCDSRPSTSEPSRVAASSSSWAIGSSLRLPLVITSGRPTPPSSKWCSGVYGSITPSSGNPGATASATERAVPPGREHDRPAGRGQLLHRRVVDLDEGRGGFAIRHHHRERLVVAGLAAAQLARRHSRRWRRQRGGSHRCP